MRKTSFILLILSLMMPISSAWAVDPSEQLDDPILEERARVISKDLRCMVCQNQSIDDSNADLAKDLRIIVRERLVDGDSNTQVVEYIVARYGNYVLLDPPMNKQTLLLWASPILSVVLGAIAIFFWFRRRKVMANTISSARSAVVAQLSVAEEKRLQELLGEKGDGSL